MIKKRPIIAWAYVWRYVTPLLLLFAAIFTFSKLTPLTYGQGIEQYVYPAHWTAVGVFVVALTRRHSCLYRLLTSITLGPTFVYALYKLVDDWSKFTGDATGLHKLWQVMVTATAVREAEWHPALEKYRHVDTKCEDDVFA